MLPLLPLEPCLRLSRYNHGQQETESYTMSFLGITRAHTLTPSPSITLITTGHTSTALCGTPLLPVITWSHRFPGKSITELIWDCRCGGSRNEFHPGALPAALAGRAPAEGGKAGNAGPQNKALRSSHTPGTRLSPAHSWFLAAAHVPPRARTAPQAASLNAKCSSPAGR